MAWSFWGLTSRDGIVPRQLHRDIGGPIARTVADAAAVFDVIAGPDPADPVTSSAQGKRPDSYLTPLDKNGLILWGRESESCDTAICMNEGCDFTCEMEPDQDAGYCEECHTNTMKAAPVLAAII